jgi:hypothetical protein
MELGRKLPMFWRNILPPSSELKRKPNRVAAYCVLVCLLAQLTFDPKNVGIMFLGNVV